MTTTVAVLHASITKQLLPTYTRINYIIFVVSCLALVTAFVAAFSLSGIPPVYTDFV